MKLGVHIVNFEMTGGTEAIGPTLAAVGEAIESAGIDNLSVMDHYFQMEMAGGPEKPMLEGYTTLGFLAGHTSRAELQLLVTGVMYRHPGILAKIVTTLDVLSGGRALLGIGASWYDREHTGLGVPFPPVAERFERLEETLQIVHQMWSDDDGPYDGEYYHLAETFNVPQAITRPHPPIMIGGTGEKKTLRLVAQYGDACNMFAGPDAGPEYIGAKLAVLEEHCRDVGSDFASIRKTILWTGSVGMDADGGRAFVEQMRGFAGVGIDEVHVMPFTGEPVAYIRGLGDHVMGELPAV
ncbi:MAG: LLM class F420-dependent oxidoreductase [Actinomycetes bacterium]